MIDTKVELIDKLVDFHDDQHGLIIQETQEIPEEHLSALQIQKADSISTPMGELHRVASIPTALVDEWLRQGFDVMKEPITEVLKRLNKYHLDKFITTRRRISALDQ